jgi:glycosyltransferase involved in cell wall biosynthesis
MNPEPAQPIPAAAPLAVCIVTETYPPEVNGVARTVQRMTEWLAARGHRVRLVRPRQGGQDKAHANGNGGPPTHLLCSLPLPMYRELRMGLAGRGAFARLWARERPDAIYVATEGPAGLGALRQAQRMGIPAVSGFHTNFQTYSTYYGVGWLKRPVFAYLRSLHNRARWTVVPTRDLKDELTAAGFERVAIVARGVDCRLFNPARRDPELRRAWGLPEDALAVLHVGRLAPEKNIDLAVSAFRALQTVAAEARLVLVGDGPARKALARAHPDLIFCGMQRGEALAAHYASGDMLLFPSETETFGNVTLEGMASGLGVVAYDYAGARAHVVDGVNGMTAPVGDTAAFTRAALALAADPDLLARVRRDARASAEAVDWDAVMGGFEHLLMDCTEVAP